MGKLQSLSPDQEARLTEWRDKWTAIGLSTAPADRPMAESAIAKMYECGGKPPPKRIVWCGSPLSMAISMALIMGIASVGASVRASVGASVQDSVWASVQDSVWDSVQDSVWASVRASVLDSVRASVLDSVRDSVGASVRAGVRASVWASVWASVGASVWASVGDSVLDSVRDSVLDSVRDSVGASVWASVRASVWDSVWDSVYGAHDAGWLSFYDFFRDVCGLKDETAALAGLLELAQSAGWAQPHEHICWVSERHNVLHRDDRGRLHCLSGPAVAYPDGWGVYAVHGVRVPDWVIETPDAITVEKIDAEQNSEVRRVMMERYGLGRYVADSGAQVVAVEGDDHPVVGLRGARLLRRESDLYERPLYYVEVVNSTAEPDGTFRRYHLAVNPAHYGGRAGREIAAAVASTWRHPTDHSALIFPTPEDYHFAGGES